MSKVIFLDVDGVLNDSFTEDRAPGGYIGLNDSMIENLAKIIKETDAKVVLVSTWKVEWDKDPAKRSQDGEYLDQKLKEHGIEIFDKTKDRVSNRGQGIIEWLNDHTDVESFVVLDDDVFADYYTYNIMPHLAQTRFYRGGLIEEIAEQSIRMLNKAV